MLKNAPLFCMLYITEDQLVIEELDQIRFKKKSVLVFIYPHKDVQCWIFLFIQSLSKVQHFHELHPEQRMLNRHQQLFVFPVFFFFLNTVNVYMVEFDGIITPED